jgi:hypothetical protein
VTQTAHYLIRPDGHVGYRAAGTDLDGLQQYLNRWLPRPSAARAPGVGRPPTPPPDADPHATL